MIKFLSALFFFLPITMFSQNTITGNVESVPSKTPAFARVTFTNISNPTEQFTTLTDINTGNYQLDVPAGTFERKIEAQNHFLYDDNMQVNNSTQMDFQVIEDIGSTSTYHPNILNVLKTLTATLDGFPDPEVERWNDSNLPIPYFANNDSMPTVLRQYLDSALLDITTKSNGKVRFTEVFTEP